MSNFDRDSFMANAIRERGTLYLEKPREIRDIQKLLRSLKSEPENQL